MKKNISILVSARLTVFALNLLALVLGFIRIFSPDAFIVGQVFGLLALCLFAANAVLAALEDFRNKSARLFLALLLLGFLLHPFLLSGYGAAKEVPLWLPLSVYFIVLFPLAIAAILTRPGSPAGIYAMKTVGVEPGSSPKPKVSVLRLILGVVAFLVGALCILTSIRTFYIADQNFGQLVLPAILPFWAPLFFALAGIAWRWMRRSHLFYRRPGLSTFAVVPALAAAVISLIPLVSLPAVSARAETVFSRLHGAEEWSFRTVIDRPAFDLGAFLVGSRHKAAQYSLDLPYLTERDRRDREHTFRFDWWHPQESGRFPVLIRIHGGAWVTGDKGRSNMNGMNRHFASLGYSVFDVQYGLNDSPIFTLPSAPPKEVVGPYGIDDMVRQLATFSTFLADHADEYNADLESVFISGGSAGGQLAIALAFSDNESWRAVHPELSIDPRLTVKGVIPFYPAVGIADDMNIPGSPELIDPILLAGSDSPPLLVYQGGVDVMVPEANTVAFMEEYRKKGGIVVPVIFPASGHESDFAFWGPYNQLFTAWMERFMKWAISLSVV